MGGWIDGWTDGWTNRQMNRQTGIDTVDGELAEQFN